VKVSPKKTGKKSAAKVESEENLEDKWAKEVDQLLEDAVVSKKGGKQSKLS